MLERALGQLGDDQLERAARGVARDAVVGADRQLPSAAGVVQAGTGPRARRCATMQVRQEPYGAQAVVASTASAPRRRPRAAASSTRRARGAARPACPSTVDPHRSRPCAGQIVAVDGCGRPAGRRGRRRTGCPAPSSASSASSRRAPGVAARAVGELEAAAGADAGRARRRRSSRSPANRQTWLEQLAPDRRASSTATRLPCPRSAPDLAQRLEARAARRAASGPRKPPSGPPTWTARSAAPSRSPPPSSSKIRAQRSAQLDLVGARVAEALVQADDLGPAAVPGSRAGRRRRRRGRRSRAPRTASRRC